MLIAKEIDVSLFCILILSFLIGNTAKRAERNQAQHRLFIALAWSVALLLAFDTITRLVEGNPVPFHHIASWVSNILLYLLVPVVPSLYVLYVVYQVFRDEHRLRKMLLPLAGIALVNTLLAVTTPITGWSFVIDSENAYHRGPYVLLHTFFCYALMLYAMITVLANKNKIEKRYFITLLFFALPPLIGGLLQTLVMGTALIWTSTSLSVLLLYFNIQDHRLDTDYLTGAFNRDILDRTIRDRIRAVAKDGPFAAILIDMDDFKGINDCHGHTSGDDALADTVKLLMGCVRRNDLIARYGGDEFLILMDIGRQGLLDKTVARIRRCIEEFNQSGARPYCLRLSIGAAVYDLESNLDAEGFIRHIDRLMYEDKRLCQQPQSEFPAGIHPH